MKTFFRPIWIVLTIFFVAYLFLILRLHFNYSTTDSDLAIYDQQIWFLSQFKLPNSSFKEGFNGFGDHFGGIEFFIAPLYWLWESPVVLLILQVVSIILSAIPIYLIFKKYIKSQEIWAIVFTIVYLLYFGFQAGNIFPFHLATISTVFIAWTLYAMLTDRWLLYWVMLALTLITKEDLPLFGITLGLVLLVRKKYWIGIATFFISLVYFYLVTYIIIPFFAHRKYTYFVSQLGDSPGEIVVNSIKNPIDAVVYFFTPLLKLRTMTAMFASFGFLTLLSPTFTILLAPFLASRFINDTIQRHLPWMHYSTNQGPILALGAILGLSFLVSFLKKRKVPKIIQQNIVPLMVSLSLVFTVGITLYYKMPLLKLIDPSFYRTPDGVESIDEAISLVPKRASVATQSGLQPHLSRRDHIFLYPHPSYAADGRVEDLPADAKPEDYQIPDTQYVLLSTKAFHWRPESLEDFQKHINYFKGLEEWELIFDKNGTTLFRKKL